MKNEPIETLNLWAISKHLDDSYPVKPPNDQELSDAGFNPFACRLLSESWAKHDCRDQSICIAYDGFEITFGKNALRMDVRVLFHELLSLAQTARLYRDKVQAVDTAGVHFGPERKALDVALTAIGALPR